MRPENQPTLPTREPTDFVLRVVAMTYDSVAAALVLSLYALLIWANDTYPDDARPSIEPLSGRRLAMLMFQVLVVFVTVGGGGGG